jgi:nicotinamide mononucleotide transporter
MEMWESITTQWQQQSIVEVFAVLFSILYIWLASEESIWCWPAGFISTFLYTWVFFDITLIFQMLLNIYYMGMAIYGFVTWSKQSDARIYISRLMPREHAIIVLGGSVLSAAVYGVAVFALNYEYLLLDIILMVFSLITTYLTVKKRLECWYYWSFINLASIFLYLQSQLYLSIVLMVIYIILAIRGLLVWHKNFTEQSLFMSANNEKR